jgi:hypothetical protein
MGILDGYVNYRRTSGGYHEETTEGKKYKSFHVNDFEFFEGFGIDELKQLVAHAKIAKADGFSAPSQKSCGIHLETWYAEALINHYFKDKKMKPLKHANLIKAWADGANIEQACRNGIGEILWCPFKGDWQEHYEYRIKPEPKSDVVRYTAIGLDYADDASERKYPTDNLKLIYDGETGKLKSAEVIK